MIIFNLRYGCVKTMSNKNAKQIMIAKDISKNNENYFLVKCYISDNFYR